MRPAFTLVELIATLALMALVAGIAVLSLDATRQRARMADVVGVLQAQEQFARGHAMRHGRATTLVLDLDQQVIERLFDDRNPSDRVIKRTGMPAGFRMDALWLGGDWHTSGRPVIPFTREGVCPDLAMRLSGPGPNTRFLLLVGLTGQWVAIDTEQDLDATLSMLGTARDDAG